MTAKKTSSEAGSKTSQLKTTSKSAAKKGAKPKVAGATSNAAASKTTTKATGPGKSVKKTVASKPRAASAQSSVSPKSRAVKAKPKTSATRPRKSRKKPIFKNKPFVMALLTVLLLGGLGVYWLFSQAPSSSMPQVSEVSRKPDVPLPKVLPKTSVKPSSSEKPDTPVKPTAKQAPAGQLAQGQSAKEQAAKEQAAKEQAAQEQAAKDQLAQGQAVKGQAVKSQPVAGQREAGQAETVNVTPADPLPKKPEVQAEVAVNNAIRFRVNPPSVPGATGPANGQATGQATGQANGEPGGEVYETTFGSLLEQSSKDIDAALVDLLKNKGFSSKNIKISEVERRSRATDAYYFQKIRLDLPETSLYGKDPALFGQQFSAALPSLLIGAELASPSPRHYIVSINGLVTHEILLKFYPPDQVGGGDEPTPIMPTPGQALLAIVIDDVGANLNAAKTLIALNYPVTLAIWPRSEYAAQCARLGHAKGLEIMIHQPMEPMEYPKNKPGAGAVFNRMSEAEISQMVSENIPLVPYAVGLNNHMGSRFTQNKQGLDAVLSAIRGKNLFVLDSVTHGGTIFYHLAKEQGFAAQRRDIFLDVSHDKNAILYQLRKSERLAHSQGYAIAIGHPLPATLEALKEWQNNRDKSVKLVRVQDLVEYKRDNGQ